MRDTVVPKSSCPACSTQLSWPDIRLARSFECPACGARLRTLSRYWCATTLGSLLVAAVLAYVLGTNIFMRLMIVALTLLPINVVLIHIVYPRLRPTLYLADHSSVT